MKLLVVEDDASLATIIRIALEANGYEVRTARDASEGYFTFLLFHPEIVVTDICLPYSDGFEMMARIRARQSNIRVIYLTAQTDQYQLQLDKEKREYCVRVLEKPFSWSELANHIAALSKEIPRQPARGAKHASSYHRT